MTEDYAADFADFAGVTYLNCAFQGPMPRVAAAAAEEALQLKKTPNLIRDVDYFDYPDAYRKAVSDLLGCRARDVAVSDSATHGIMCLVQGLDWHAGDEVVLASGEFPANRFPWLALERKGVVVREVPAGPGRAGLERMEAALGAKTRVVAASWVSYSSGQRLDIHALGSICKERGVLFAVDGTQGVGGLELSLASPPCDLLACAGYKWLLGPYGLGFVWIEPGLAERLEPGNVNWFAIEGARDFNRLSECELAFVPGASRFDVNETANFSNVAAGVAALRYLERVGVGTVERHVAALLNRLVSNLPAGFREAGAAAEPPRSNILCLESGDRQRTERAADALVAGRFFISRREGAIRLSPHLFNSVADVDRVLEVLEASETGASVAADTVTVARLPVGERAPAGEAARPEARALEGRRVALRPLDPERDVEQLYDASHGDAERESVWTYLFEGPFADRAEMLDTYRRRAATTDPLYLTVVDGESSKAIGGAAFQRVVPRNRCLEIASIWYVPEVQRSHVNTETVYLMLREAFDRLGYRRVEWKCDALNRRSRIAALRLGFRFEGIFQRHMIVKGRSRDTAWFGMTDRDWPGVKRDLERWLYSGETLSLTRLTQTRQAAARLADG